MALVLPQVHWPSLHFLMQIGQGTQLNVAPPMAYSCFLALVLFHGLLRSKLVSRLSTEAEYRALATTTTELSWLRIWFKELRIFLSHFPVIWCDIISAIALSANPVFHSRTKHIEVDFHYVREKVLHRDLCVGFVSGKDSLANVFTKPLPAPLLLLQRCKLLVDSSPRHLRGDVEDSYSKINSRKKQDQNDRVLRQD